MSRGKGHKPDFVHVGVSVIFLRDQPETVSPKERETGSLVVSYLILLRMGLALRNPLAGVSGGLLHRLFTLTVALANDCGMSLWRFPFLPFTGRLPVD